MKSVLELATSASVNISQIDLVRQNLEKALSGKKFLLVLDDVWNKDPFEWGKLKAALTCGTRGSKILVTTRSQQVSSIMGSSNTIHQIQQLSGDDYLYLFQQFAFGDQAVDQNLMEIGEKIAKKCGGVPLAAISLGSMLRITRDETYWSSVLNSEIWQLGNEEDQVLAVLKLSYDTLPLRSKKCFAFASLFSKNDIMAKDELIKLWIANGFVRSEGNFNAETAGNRVFDDLVLRSFFLLVPSQDVIRCTIHDLMHDLARSVSADVYWNSEQDSVENIGKRTYHLKISLSEESSMTHVLGKKPLYLRTFMSRRVYSPLRTNMFEGFLELKFLRSIDLPCNGIIEVPTSIGNLIHLRYLNLSRNGIKVLPDSITLLPNLQYLDLSFNEELQELPEELGNMQSLRELDCRHLDFQELLPLFSHIQNIQDLDLLRALSHFNFGLTHMPCGLSRLTNLQSLGAFYAGDRTGACSIIELEDLKLHGEMNIIFSKDFTNYSCGGRKILKNKDLNELRLEFNGSERYDKEMLDDLCPNKSLKKLSICNYGSRQFPAWLMESQLSNLVEVSLKNCRGCEHIPPFGNLQFLKKLDLRSINGITHMGVEFHGHGGFPSLQELILNELYNLEEWLESHGVDELFPKLQSLKIFACPRLKSMPRLPTIQYLDIFWCSGSLLSCVGRLTSLSLLRLVEMDDMTSLPNGCIRNLTSLTTFEIQGCKQLQCLPGDEMQHLEIIRSLTIYRCNNLASFPSEVGCLGSLRSLSLRGCPSIKVQPEVLVQILNSLHKFQIEICHKNVDIRRQLQHLHTLKELFITGVHGRYKNHSYIGRNNATQLGICCCDELESLITAEPTSNVLEELYIDEIFKLTTLPDWLRHLESLRVLSIHNCSELGLLPRGLKNLPMLETFRVSNCPQLKRRCEREIGEDWPIISHLPFIDIS
ncbi:putative disease resistance protein RGA4 [Zingiber officinale]|uniref:putative disease resistance protein RGA4 n=1 Tax=Zingiber officinale TaxID=94328 RepID=UPI001C4B1C7B|nr:putative disease resistance protein RGA4 [Zingiber officinale]